MADMGVKASRPGFDALTCADKELLFSTAFQTLKIHAQGSQVVTAGAGTVTVAHNLGYYPAFYVLYNDGTGTMREMNSACRVDANNLYIDRWSNITAYYYIFRHNLTTEIDQRSILTTPTTVGGSGDYGIKMAKAGFGFDADRKNLIIDSSARQHIIHYTHSEVVSGSDTVDITHNLGYPPLYLAYAKANNSNYVESLMMSSVFTTAWIKSDFIRLNFAQVYWGWTTSWTAYILIFKDPSNE